MKNSSIIILTLILFSNIKISAQECTEPDATIWENTWASCSKTMNPISDYGQSHWIQYDLGSVRKLSKTWIWNTNDPDELDQGFKTVKVDYSLDGENWTNWGEMEFPRAEGQAIYGGFEGPDLVNIDARYVLLTAMSNHGHPSCAGLAEVKFNLLPIQGDTKTGGENGEEDCIEIEEIIVEEVNSSEAFIFWEIEDDEIIYDFQIRIAGTEDWYLLELEEPEIFLEDLEPNTDYEFIIGFECDEEYFETIVNSFSTKQCATVNEIPIIEVQSYSASFEWVPIEDIDFYLVTFGLADEAPLDTFYTEEPFFLLDDLDDQTEYRVAVGTECNEDIIWSTPLYFFTASDLTTSTKEDPLAQQELLRLFPNPTAGRVVFTYQTLNPDVLNYQIYDLTGKSIFQNTTRIGPGINTISLDLTNLQGGVYILETVTAEKRTRSSLRIVRN